MVARGGGGGGSCAWGWVGAAEHKAVHSRAVCVSQPWASSPL